MYQVKSVIAELAFTNGVKKYLKEGTSGLMNTKNISSKKLTESPSQCNEEFSSKEIAEIRSQMQGIQIEIVVLKKL